SRARTSTSRGPRSSSWTKKRRQRPPRTTPRAGAIRPSDEPGRESANARVATRRSDLGPRQYGLRDAGYTVLDQLRGPPARGGRVRVVPGDEHGQPRGCAGARRGAVLG